MKPRRRVFTVRYVQLEEIQMISKLLLVSLPVCILLLLYRVGLFEAVDIDRITPNRILVRVQQCTCPVFFVEKGSDQLKSAFRPEVKVLTAEVFSAGKTPFEHMNFPEVSQSQYVLEGRAIRTKSIGGTEQYPVFQIDNWVAVNKVVLIWSKEGLWSIGLGLVWMGTAIVKVLNMRTNWT